MCNGFCFVSVVLLILACIFAFSAGITWLICNWWLPYTKIETNGLRYRVMQLNVFRIWQEYGNYGSMESAEYTANRQVKEWHERNDKFRPLEKHERVAAKIAYFNKDRR